jgi:cellulose synthase/poly-beta-1,6-N-acetylglucosamine synthase-like glycosyltransferase
MYVIGACAALCVLYDICLLISAALAFLFPQRRSAAKPPTTRFCLLIPAHDEELVIAQTMASIEQLNYPRNLLTVVVIADNCTDRTADIASENDAVVVLKRIDLRERGKGYALNWAVAELSERKDLDTFVVVDADTRIDPQFLLEMDDARCGRERGTFVAQGRYDVLNANENWRTALMAGALTLVHVVRPSAREWLRLTVGLKGNGMCFDRETLADVPWRGHSITEDIDQTLDLLEKLNRRVVFVPKAIVAAIMPTSESAAVSQRQRWENGRGGIVKGRALSLVLKGLSGFKATFVDAALDLIVPPLAEQAALLASFAAMVGVYAAFGGHWHFPVMILASTAVAFGIYILGGFILGGAPALAYRALFFAPFYALWKIMVKLRGSSAKSGAWVRTERETAADGEPIVPTESANK